MSVELTRGKLWPIETLEGKEAAERIDQNFDGLVNDLRATQAALNALGGGGATGASSLLAIVSYKNGSTYTTSSNTPADVDATNLVVSFTVPLSGRVLVRQTAFADSSASGPQYRWGLREGTTDISGAGGTVSRDPDGSAVSIAYTVTGLIGGASKTWKWSHACDQTVPATGRILQSGNFPAATLEIWSA